MNWDFSFFSMEGFTKIVNPVLQHCGHFDIVIWKPFCCYEENINHRRFQINGVNKARYFKRASFQKKSNVLPKCTWTKFLGVVK